MPTRTKLRAGIKSILKLAAPIGAANLAIVCSGTIDTIMAGQTSAEDLAGGALGIAVATWISISLAGILQGVSPISGFAFGAKRFREVGDSLHQCLYLAVGLAVPGLVLTLQTKMWMAVAETSGLVAEIASQYLLFAGLALPAILCGRTFIAVNAAVSRPAASMFVTLGIVVLKIPVNWFCMNKLGFGGAGTGLSTCMLSWLALGAEVLEESEFEPMFAECEPALNGKKIAIFGSYGWGSGEWMDTWEAQCQADGAVFAAAPLICHETPDEAGLADCTALGEALV